MYVAEYLKDKLDRESVEGVTSVGYGRLYKLQRISIFADGADQTGETARELAVCVMACLIGTLRCIALDRWQVDVGLGQTVRHVV